MVHDHLYLIIIIAVHPWSNHRLQTLPCSATRFRQPYGTQNALLSAASVKIWHGSKCSVA